MARVAYDEFAYFADNAAEAGLPYAGPPTVARTSVEVRPGFRLSALVWGTAPPSLVFLHGGAQNAHTWDTVALALDRPLVAVDLPGHGHSDGGDHSQLSLDDNAADVAGAVRVLAPEAWRHRRRTPQAADASVSELLGLASFAACSRTGVGACTCAPWWPGAWLEEDSGEGVAKPAFVLVGAPAPVDGEETVDLGCHDGEDGVGGGGFGHAVGEAVAVGEGAGDAGVACESLFLDRGEELGGTVVDGRGLAQHPMQGGGAIEDFPAQPSETFDDLPRVLGVGRLLGEGAVVEGERRVVSDESDLEDRFEDAELGLE